MTGEGKECPRLAQDTEAQDTEALDITKDDAKGEVESFSRCGSCGLLYRDRELLLRIFIDGEETRICVLCARTLSMTAHEIYG